MHGAWGNSALRYPKKKKRVKISWFVYTINRDVK